MRRSPSTPSRNWVMHQFTDGFHHEKGRNNAMKNAVLCKVKASCESCVWIIENGETCCVVNVKPCETIKSGGENHRQWQVSRQKMMVLPSKIMVLPLKMNVYHHFFLRAQIVVCNHKWLFDHPNVGLTIKNNGNGFRIRNPGFDVTFVVLPSRMVVLPSRGRFYVKPC